MSQSQPRDSRREHLLSPGHLRLSDQTSSKGYNYYCASSVEVSIQVSCRGLVETDQAKNPQTDLKT